MASKKQIMSFWMSDPRTAGHLQSQLDTDDLDVCWTCGRRIGVQRCHIVAHVSGGSGGADNLHLLCPGCHAESEMREGDAYWAWFDYKLNTDFIDPEERSDAKFLAITGMSKMDAIVLAVTDIPAASRVFSLGIGISEERATEMLNEAHAQAKGVLT